MKVVARRLTDSRAFLVALGASVLLLVVGSPRGARAQTGRACATDRTVSTLVGAGLGAAVAAIPATIVHRHDEASSHRIVAVSIPAGALIGFLAAGRDHPCAGRGDSSGLADQVLVIRSRHAGRGAVAGAVIGAVLGAVGGTFYSIGCTGTPCHPTRARVGVMLFSAGEGAAAGGLLGSLIGWAWPAGRR